ncbi:MAG TPA: hypothetical protein VHB27_00170 [Rhodopila sp.]|uniref:hypothetical protein n=1 Tax=Rhodopila sp. TaxID=2480087 RepID=UPI002BFBFD1B|nr:hypothetical protein [Rhodopila sp.]HVY13608.1 hypothetical protein [Rhodopila sp.]
MRAKPIRRCRGCKRAAVSVPAFCVAAERWPGEPVIAIDAAIRWQAPRMNGTAGFGGLAETNAAYAVASS